MPIWGVFQRKFCWTSCKDGPAPGRKCSWIWLCKRVGDFYLWSLWSLIIKISERVETVLLGVQFYSGEEHISLPPWPNTMNLYFFLPSPRNSACLTAHRLNGSLQEEKIKICGVRRWCCFCLICGGVVLFLFNLCKVKSRYLGSYLLSFRRCYREVLNRKLWKRKSYAFELILYK